MLRHFTWAKAAEGTVARYREAVAASLRPDTRRSPARHGPRAAAEEAVAAEKPAAAEEIVVPNRESRATC